MSDPAPRGHDPSGKLTALVLAGSRAGRPDPMAVAAGVSHKALLLVDGTPMLVRVLRALRACPEVGQIIVSAERVEALLTSLPEAHGVLGRDAAPSPAQSVSAVLDEFGPRLLVTTADHALLTPSMLSYFISEAPPGADAVAAVARSEIVCELYPETKRTWLRFRGVRLSGCNLFLFQTEGAAFVLQFWQRVEQHRKHPLAMALLIGPAALLGYAFRLLTIQGMLRLAGRRMGANLAMVEMPFADAAIDVDKPADLELARSTAARRKAYTDSVS